MSPNDADGMANSVDTDQTGLGLQLFVQTCLSENLGTLRYTSLIMRKPVYRVCDQLKIQTGLLSWSGSGSG